MTLALLALLWGTWCLGHSLLISSRVQEMVRRRLPRHFRFYRLFYNGFALVSLLPVLGYSRSLDTALLWSWRGPGMLPWALLWGLVLFLGIQGSKAYEMGYISGLRQALDPAAPASPAPFSRSGILSVIRHPWYLGALILLWIRSRDICLSTLVENLILTLYIFIGIRFEEKKLVQIYGETYREYKKSVPALVPLGRALAALTHKS